MFTTSIIVVLQLHRAGSQWESCDDIGAKMPVMLLNHGECDSDGDTAACMTK